jgi:Na+/melibiose symporter-like transporter
MILDLGDIEDLHKWMGLAFVIAGAIHVAINWRVLIAYFRGRRIVVWGAAMLLVCALLLFAVGDRDVDDGLEGEAAEYVRELVDD